LASIDLEAKSSSPDFAAVKFISHVKVLGAERGFFDLRSNQVFLPMRIEKPAIGAVAERVTIGDKEKQSL